MAKAFLEMLAGLPQTPKHFPRDLRDSRKSKRERFGACGSSANQKENALALAGLPQIKKRTFWRLRKFRKHSQKHFGRYSALSKTSFRDKDPHFLSPNPHFVTWETNISIECNQDQSKYTSHKYPRVFPRELSLCRE